MSARLRPPAASQRATRLIQASPVDGSEALRRMVISDDRAGAIAILIEPVVPQ